MIRRIWRGTEGIRLGAQAKKQCEGIMGELMNHITITLYPNDSTVYQLNHPHLLSIHKIRI